MNIVIRTDASDSLGTGHVMRCLTLADELRSYGAKISFICREETGNLIELIEKKTYKVHTISTSISLETDKKLTQNVLKNQPIFPDWLIIDHYEIDISWESSLRMFTKKIMVIDDLANKKHDCDILLNQNYGTNENKYKGLVPEDCIRLIGPKNALLRPLFVKLRENIKESNGEIKRILVSMGGADTTNETCKVLRAITMLNRADIATDVIIGSSNSNLKEIRALASQMPNTTSHYHVENMAELMLAADLSIGGGGTTTWERCCFGLPTLIITIAENQVDVIEKLAKDGYVIYSGWHKDVTEQNIFEDVLFLLRHEEIVRRMSSIVKNIVDGNGVKRVANYIMNNLQSIYLRPVTIDDCERVFEWRNHPEVRKYSFDPSPLSWDEHKQWFSKKISSSKAAFLIGEKDNIPVGVLRYDFRKNDAHISIYVSSEFLDKGIGTKLLKKGNNWIKEHYPKINKIIANIIPGNHQSVKVFQKAGFKENSLTHIFNLQ
tara:strand:+ start:11059 stop:12534 length:1476 start_codon:yes stop_codon:yes gene_type:complete